ncbi:unnamed protein product [Paramecium sonneborni]|uniref:rhomboid protease n=1 Tax=Paramecium sonneborni TaxID=65129 RepID=A0A8S1PRG6_9CILI|nr:unnamed protein product [Paramecium sonneborni]
MSFAQSSTGQPTPQALMSIWRSQESDPPYFINFQNSLKYPRDEKFTEMITYTCLPTFKLQSMTTILIIFNSFYFIILIISGDIKDGGQFLEPNQNSLYSLGMLYPYRVKYEQEIQRLFLSLLLYSNFINYFSCQVAVAIYGSYVEKLLGWKKLWMISVFGGFGGTLLSCCYTSKLHINGVLVPSTFNGVLFGYTLLKWDKWSYSGSGRYQMVGVIIFGLIIFFWQAWYWEIIDQIGILGSYLYGTLLAFAFSKQLMKVDYDTDLKCVQISSIILILVILGCEIFYFFWISQPLRLEI